MSTSSKNLSVADAEKRIQVACLQSGSEAGLFSHVSLTPIGGFEEKVKPPTYVGSSGTEYAEEERYIDGKPVKTVYLDTVQSSANRMEMALLDYIRSGGDGLNIPSIDVYCKFNDSYRSILELPHRFSDAHIQNGSIREASFNVTAAEKAKSFRDTELGKRIYRTSEQKFHDEIIRFSPISVLFGAWNSFANGPNEEINNKLHRCIVCETVAVKSGNGVHTKSRIDPIILGGEIAGKPAAKTGVGNIPPTIVRGAPGGVSVSQITENWSLSFQALHRYTTAKYKPGDEKEFRKRQGEDAVVREMLVWLGLGMHILRGNNYFYRSGCSLQKADTSSYSFSSDGLSFSPTLKNCIDNYSRAAAVLEKAGRYDRKLSLVLTLNAKTDEEAKKSLFKETKKNAADAAAAAADAA